MDYLVKIIDSIAWPIAAIWLGYIFKSELKSLLARMSKFKYGEIEAQFEQIKTELENISIEAQPILKVNKINEHNKRYEYLMSLAESSPRAAILETWIQIESELLSLCKRANFTPSNPKNTLTLIHDMVKEDILPSNIFPLIYKLRKLRNEAAHLPEFVFDEASKKSFSVAIGIANLLKTIKVNQQNDEN